MKKIMMVLAMCLMMVGCGSGSMISKIELVEEETQELFEGSGTINGAKFSMHVNIKKDDIENLYDVIRSMDEEICKKVKINRYDTVMIDIYDKDDCFIGFMDIENIGNGIMYDLTTNKLGDDVEDIKVK